MPFSQSCYGNRLCNFHGGTCEQHRILIQLCALTCLSSAAAERYLVHGVRVNEQTYGCSMGGKTKLIVSMEMSDMLLNRPISRGWEMQGCVSACTLLVYCLTAAIYSSLFCHVFVLREWGDNKMEKQIFTSTYISCYMMCLSCMMIQFFYISLWMQTSLSVCILISFILQHLCCGILHLVTNVVIYCVPWRCYTAGCVTQFKMYRNVIYNTLHWRTRWHSWSL